jgi:proliferating cell nuclear antigen
MLTATITSSSQFKQIVDAIKEVSFLANFAFHETGVTVQSMDSSHVSICNVHVKKCFFGQYKCEQPLTIGVSVVNLALMLGCVDGGTVKLRCEDVQPDHLELICDKGNFKMNLINLDVEMLGFPDMEYTFNVDVSSSLLYKTVKDLRCFGTVVDMRCIQRVGGADTCIVLDTTGDIGEASMVLCGNHSTRMEEDTECESCHVAFGMQYIAAFTKAHVLSERVQLSISECLPIRMVFELSGAAGTVTYFLAPKIEDDK